MHRTTRIGALVVATVLAGAYGWIPATQARPTPRGPVRTTGVVLPPPKLKGLVSAVRIEGDEIVQTFGSGAAARIRPPAVSKNHIYWRGGELRFGKLTMRGADLELIDQDPSDAFDFSVAHYNDMLVGGYSKNLPRLGLRTYMPDYNDLAAGRKPVPK